MIKATSESSKAFLNTQLGKIVNILAEREVEPGIFEGYTENYTPARIRGVALNGKIINARVTNVCDGYVMCESI